MSCSVLSVATLHHGVWGGGGGGGGAPPLCQPAAKAQRPPNYTTSCPSFPVCSVFRPQKMAPPLCQPVAKAQRPPNYATSCPSFPLCSVFRPQKMAAMQAGRHAFSCGENFGFQGEKKKSGQWIPIPIPTLGVFVYEAPVFRERKKKVDSGFRFRFRLLEFLFTRLLAGPKPGVKWGRVERGANNPPSL